MNNQLLSRQDPRVADLFRRMEKVIKTLDKLKVPERRPLHGERFITDSELSALLRISRRTLQEYRTAGVFPYYMICGKIVYKESELVQLLEDCRKQSFDEQELI
jgi:hypothetical protein